MAKDIILLDHESGARQHTIIEWQGNRIGNQGLANNTNSNYICHVDFLAIVKNSREGVFYR